MATRVFIIWSHPLFHETVSALLGQPEIQIIGSSSEHQSALAEIETLRPDTIIIEQSESGMSPDIEALRILEASAWEPRIIRLSLDDNELWVYHREQRLIEHTEDLLRLIQGDPRQGDG